MRPLTPSLRQHGRLPLTLLLLVTLVSAATGYAPPAGRLNWALEVGPGLLAIGVLVATYPRVPLSHFVYVCVFLHYLVLVYGGYYTYANTPLGNWAKESFALSRNHYDRIGHLALGVFPCFLIREVLLRKTPLKASGWLTFLVLSVVLAIAAFWELLEWWVTLIAAGDVGQAFLGAQGDPWDAQWDMLLALLGAAIARPLLWRLHDRSFNRVPAAEDGYSGTTSGKFVSAPERSE